MVTKVLCVAEKPSIAKAVAGHLAGGHFNTHNVPNAKYNKNYSFQYTFPRWGQCEVTMTSVSGHILSQDFNERYRRWHGCDPADLFDASIETYVDKDKEGIAKNIETQARYSQYLYIWTDCDREGEHIGTEIRGIAAKGNARLLDAGKTVRARFSNIERAHIINAARSPVTIDEAQANAVASRIELDLRIGSSYTRYLSLTLSPMLQQQGGEDRQLISYGSCQFPTLGFVVDRYFRVKNFKPEPFWSIGVTHKKDGIDVKFRWARGHLFDRMMVTVLFERCIAAKTAKVTQVQTKPTSKWKPLPLTTVELQKCGSRFLRLSSQRVMQVAESLYQKGWISYPRTETDQFDKDMDLRALIQKQTQGNAGWSQFAQTLMDGEYQQPRSGRNNDKAHPPIHPVNFVNPSSLETDERKVHEFVVRRFLACCSKDAQGLKTEIELLFGAETFKASGLTVTERNYLDVYPYDKWTSSQDLPNFRPDEVFTPTEALMHEGKTTAPGYLTEPELIGLMDANGIGTDATMADHIATIQKRNYVTTRTRGRQSRADGENEDDEDEAEQAPTRGNARGRGRGRGRGDSNAPARGATSGVQEFIPTTLGVALVEGYESMQFESSLAKPFLRKEFELKMKAICDGQKTRQEVVQESIEQYRDLYNRAQRQVSKLQAAVRKYVFNDATAE
ncbi:hypothetical protein AMS68_001824 [Peltaster fructicola]|uniref:DNA topoisomerase n=1 Tax=Peltaster fructicola TaxID=286661 RepID=A0A6H0XNH4_9PEZI|nr:hypothetical protein AMS68_001824 [Peltaster fructicola]